MAYGLENRTDSWAVKHGSYDYDLSAGNLGNRGSLRMCAMGRMEIRVGDAEIAFERVQGDGWAGC